MNWKAVCEAYPERWLIIEALEAHTEDNQRWLDRIAVGKRDASAATCL